MVLVEMKKTRDERYISDSVYKVFGYLYDFIGSERARSVKAILVVPTGISEMPGSPHDRAVLLASGDDRVGMSAALRAALLT